MKATRRRLLGAGTALGGLATLAWPAAPPPAGPPSAAWSSSAAASAAPRRPLPARCGAATSTSPWSSATPASCPARSPTWCSAATADGRHHARLRRPEGHGHQGGAGRGHGGRCRRQEGAAGRRRRTALRPARRVARHRLHVGPGRRPSGRRRQRPRGACLEGRPADGGPAPAARVHGRRRRGRDLDPQGALPLPARAVRARLHGGQLPEDRQAEEQAAGARRQPRDPVQEGLFEKAFKDHYSGILEYRPNAEIKEVSGKVAKLEFEDVRPTCST
jgi:hypothetical protein